jgi:hypothetical protein
MEYHAVSPAVNKPSYNKPDCIAPVEVQQGLDFG